jgi:hypothetical protein
VGDQCLGARGDRRQPCQFGLGGRGLRPGTRRIGEGCRKGGLQGGELRRNGFMRPILRRVISRLEQNRSTAPESPCRSRPPGLAWVAPVDPVEQITELCR